MNTVKTRPTLSGELQYAASRPVTTEPGPWLPLLVMSESWCK